MILRAPLRAVAILFLLALSAGSLALAETTAASDCSSGIFAVVKAKLNALIEPFPGARDFILAHSKKELENLRRKDFLLNSAIIEKRLRYKEGRFLIGMIEAYRGEERNLILGYKRLTLYLNDEEKAQYQIHVSPEGKILDANGNPFHEQNFDIVIDPEGRIYIYKPASSEDPLIVPAIHHSSFNRGGYLLGACEVQFDPETGDLIQLDPWSGHYLAGDTITKQVADILRKAGVNTSRMKTRTVLQMAKSINVQPP